MNFKIRFLSCLTGFLVLALCASVSAQTVLFSDDFNTQAVGAVLGGQTLNNGLGGAQSAVWKDNRAGDLSWGATIETNPDHSAEQMMRLNDWWIRVEDPAVTFGTNYRLDLKIRAYPQSTLLAVESVLDDAHFANAMNTPASFFVNVTPSGYSLVAHDPSGTAINIPHSAFSSDAGDYDANGNVPVSIVYTAADRSVDSTINAAVLINGAFKGLFAVAMPANAASSASVGHSIGVSGTNGGASGHGDCFVDDFVFSQVSALPTATPTPVPTASPTPLAGALFSDTFDTQGGGTAIGGQTLNNGLGGLQTATWREDRSGDSNWGASVQANPDVPSEDMLRCNDWWATVENPNVTLGSAYSFECKMRPYARSGYIGVEVNLTNGVNETQTTASRPTEQFRVQVNFGSNYMVQARQYDADPAHSGHLITIPNAAIAADTAADYDANGNLPIAIVYTAADQTVDHTMVANVMINGTLKGIYSISQPADPTSSASVGHGVGVCGEYAGTSHGEFYIDDVVFKPAVVATPLPTPATAFSDDFNTLAIATDIDGHATNNALGGTAPKNWRSDDHRDDWGAMIQVNPDHTSEQMLRLNDHWALIENPGVSFGHTYMYQITARPYGAWGAVGCEMNVTPGTALGDPKPRIMIRCHWGDQYVAEVWGPSSPVDGAMPAVAVNETDANGNIPMAIYYTAADRTADSTAHFTVYANGWQKGVFNVPMPADATGSTTVGHSIGVCGNYYGQASGHGEYYVDDLIFTNDATPMVTPTPTPSPTPTATPTPQFPAVETILFSDDFESEAVDTDIDTQVTDNALGGTMSAVWRNDDHRTGWSGTVQDDPDKASNKMLRLNDHWIAIQDPGVAAGMDYRWEVIARPYAGLSSMGVDMNMASGVYPIPSPSFSVVANWTDHTMVAQILTTKGYSYSNVNGAHPEQGPLNGSMPIVEATDYDANGNVPMAIYYTHQDRSVDSALFAILYVNGIQKGIFHMSWPAFTGTGACQGVGVNGSFTNNGSNHGEMYIDNAKFTEIMIPRMSADTSWVLY